MINENIRVNNEFYVSVLIKHKDSKKSEILILKRCGGWTPEDLNYYLENYKWFLYHIEEILMEK